MSKARRRGSPQWWSNAPASSAIPALHMVQLPPIIKISTKLFTLLLIVSLFSVLFLPWQQTAAGTGRVIAFDRLQRHLGLEFRREPAPCRHLVSLRQAVGYTLSDCPIFRDHLRPS